MHTSPGVFFATPQRDEQRNSVLFRILSAAIIGASRTAVIAR
jgi:hypothetical protein